MQTADAGHDPRRRHRRTRHRRRSHRRARRRRSFLAADTAALAELRDDRQRAAENAGTGDVGVLVRAGPASCRRSRLTRLTAISAPAAAAGMTAVAAAAITAAAITATIAAATAGVATPP